ncbi:hypothetical protein QR98_0006400 [Sarcoptes scabiei]|uniref:Uncharacterized protein n=1 Tax=Sarcoptes scabiei TaxID=52283 RepID=A0A131ZUH8_SARSC|nr:hypothetical protein QR98_0006400 [Sarcoptes scabiei]
MAKVMKWFDQSTNNNPFVNDITRIWLDSLNEKSCKSIEEVLNGIFLEFVSLEQAQSPKLEQIGDSEQFNDNIITTMKASCDRLILQVRALPGLGYDVNRSAIYDVVLEKFSSSLKVICMTEQSIFVVRPLERPQTKAQIEGPILGSKNKYQPDVIINAVINVLSNTSLDLNFEKYCGFPKASTLITSHPMIGKKSQNKSNRPLANKSTSNIDQKLLIKVVKGYDLDFTDGDENGLLISFMFKY